MSLESFRPPPLIITPESPTEEKLTEPLPYDVSPKVFKLPTSNVKNKKSSDYLKMVSWNINMEGLSCLSHKIILHKTNLCTFTEHSSYAPKNWSKTHDKWDLIFKQTLKQKPDIITFQEVK